MKKLSQTKQQHEVHETLQVILAQVVLSDISARIANFRDSAERRSVCGKAA